jgi:hypothetical protein
MPTTLRSGEVAIVAYATDDGFHGNGDIIRFVVSEGRLRPAR